MIHLRRNSFCSSISLSFLVSLAWLLMILIPSFSLLYFSSSLIIVVYSLRPISESTFNKRTSKRSNRTTTTCYRWNNQWFFKITKNSNIFNESFNRWFNFSNLGNKIVFDIFLVLFNPNCCVCSFQFGYLPVDSIIFILQEKPHFKHPGISRKAQKDQVSIIFTSPFCLKKGRIFYHQKVQNRNFSVISKYHLSITFFPQKRLYFPSPKD